ncbi:sulfur oxidation c-type cytochrome SoxX [Thalassospiraceae bacterium LMO-JJ14]|nr:sulfur oxidation c-type cytochrome SoxX [Thalassospiraceae bacterium LMO-JJ14]
MPKLRTFVPALAAAFLLAGTAYAADLVKYEVVDNSVNKSLTGKAGDPQKGVKTFTNRKLGNCLACHQVTALSAQPFHGEIGPSLDGVAGRYSEGQLRMQVINAKVINPDTIMPAFYRVNGFHRVLDKFKDKPILNAEEVEDVVAYLKTLK